MLFSAIKTENYHKFYNEYKQRKSTKMNFEKHKINVCYMIIKCLLEAY